MINSIFIRIHYQIPIWKIAFILASLFMVFSLIGRLCTKKISIKNRKEKLFHSFCFILLILYFTFVLWYTLFRRNPKLTRIIFPFPFYRVFFEKTDNIDEIIRGYLMNFFLFFPFGMLTAWLLKGDKKKRILKTITFAFLFSFFIEFLQYVLMLGTAETDDVLFNTLGAAVGSLSVLFHPEKGIGE